MGGRSRWDGFPNSWGYKRAGRQSGRGKRRKQTSVYVSSLCRASISEQRDYLPSGQGGKEEEFGGERSGYRGGRRPRRFESGRRVLPDGRGVARRDAEGPSRRGVVSGTVVSLLGATGHTANSRMPVVPARLNGRCFSCLVDTGSERTIISSRVVEGMAGRLKPGRPLLTADGSISRKGRDCRVVIALEGHCFGIPVLVMPELGNLGVDCLLGGDVIDHMGGVTVRRDPHLKYVVSWGNPRPTSCCGMSSDGHVQAALASGVAGKSVSRSQRAPAPLRIDDSDFVADFADGRWVVSWRWSRELPKTLQTRIGEYKCTQAPHVRERYNAEIQRWISKGWLKEWRGPIEGIIPLLAVFQPSKDKVRPVMDYRELNDFVECHTGDVIAVCGEKIREWLAAAGRA
ncbi:hypothetical protein GQR58_005653 [Nymphon striatum]|nr:hypothetical protein GQR58_005653 [Nymphon striatum]